MNIEDIKHLIETSSAVQVKNIDSIIEFVLGLYKEHRIEGTSLDKDGDMLLYQWGTYDWGNGEYFNLDITRQVVEDLEDPDDEADSMQQLSVTLLFETNSETKELSSGNAWCSTPSEIDDFIRYITDSQAYKWAINRKPLSLAVVLEYV